MDNVLDWLEAKPRSARLPALLGIALAPFAAMVAVTLVLPAAAPIFGCAAGVGLFLAVYGYWHTVLPAEKRRATNYKASTPLVRRRANAAAIAAIWVVILLLVGRFAPGPLMGTLNVFVILSLYTYFRATPEEAADALAAYEAAQAEKAAQAEAANHDDNA